MLRSFNIAVSGMRANSNALSVIANNISNDQTVAFKQQQAIFEELFYQAYGSASAPTQNSGGMNPQEIGNGVKLGSITSIQTQGTIVSTGNKTDMAIQGEGFFVVGDSVGGNREYTRAGTFTTNKNNQLVTNGGQYVLGWNLDPLTNTISTTSGLSPITINIGSASTPKQSTQMTIRGNLNAAAKVGDIYSMQTPTWDSLGTRHDLNMDYIKTGANTYQYVVSPSDGFQASANITQAVFKPSSAIAGNIQKGDYTITTTPNGSGQVDISVMSPDGTTQVVNMTGVNDVDGPITLTDAGGNPWFTINYKSTGAGSNATFTVADTGTMTYNSSGQLTSVLSETGSDPIATYTSPTTGNPVNVEMDFSALTGISADSILAMTATDGQGAAILADFGVGDGGIIQGYYSDGTVKQIGQVATAFFVNAAGLSRLGSGNYQVTANSGDPDIGVSGTGARGIIKAQSTESSNVDLATEFVNMMTTQKAYQANTKIIQTSNEILSDVINLIR